MTGLGGQTILTASPGVTRASVTVSHACHRSKHRQHSTLFFVKTFCKEHFSAIHGYAVHTLGTDSVVCRGADSPRSLTCSNFDPGAPHDVANQPIDLLMRRPRSHNVILFAFKLPTARPSDVRCLQTYKRCLHETMEE